MWGEGMHGWGGWGAAMGLMMFLSWLLVVAGVVFVAWFFARLARASRQEQAPPPREDALEVLRKRYARGEISREQYQEIRRDLEG